MGIFKKLFSREKKETLDHGLEKTKEGFLSKIKRAIAGKNTIDDDVLDNLEEVFITSDVGVDTTLKSSTASRSASPKTPMSAQASSTSCYARRLPTCLPRTIPSRRQTTSPCPKAINRT